MSEEMSQYELADALLERMRRGAVSGNEAELKEILRRLSSDTASPKDIKTAENFINS